MAEAEALADRVALHHRNLTTIYITHGHFDHFFGLSVLLDRFPSAHAIATPKSVELMQEQWDFGVLGRGLSPTLAWTIGYPDGHGRAL